jgi:hypothetical protein
MLIHITQNTNESSQDYSELHRERGHTFSIKITFYPHSIQYSTATIAVLDHSLAWTELAEFSIDLWHQAAVNAEGDNRISVFKQVAAFLLTTGQEATGLIEPTPAQED